MKKVIASAAIAAITMSSLVVPMPVLAEAPTEDQQAALDAYCIAIRAPSENAAVLVTTAANANSIATVGGTTTKTFDVGSEHLHGGSPNIFGTFTVETTGAATRFTFDCVTQNTASGNYPEGLQNPGQTYDVPDSTGDSIVSSEDGVICISPNKNPGAWRGQNGYATVNCGYSLYRSLAGKFDPFDPPTNSLPHIG
jgi:hypothetical protein